METKLFSFVLIPGFSLVAFSCAIDALRGANQALEHEYYSRRSISAESGPIDSSSDIAVPTVPLAEIAAPDVVAVCGGVRSHDYKSETLTNWLHARAKSGVKIGSISDGSFVVAEAGLFDDCASTIHWKCQDAYRERFPKLDIRTSMIEISPQRFSCAGGTASLDLMLNFIREDHGPELVSQIAQNYFHDTIRDGSREQHLTNAFRVGGANPVLSEAILTMERHLEYRLDIGEIADKVGISRRQLDRIFKTNTGQSPHQFYTNLRLTRAAGLLMQTSMSVTEIAIGCGFQSASHMGRFFTPRFGTTPGAYRRSQYQTYD